MGGKAEYHSQQQTMMRAILNNRKNDKNKWKIHGINDKM